jgi:hypothetical protein
VPFHIDSATVTEPTFSLNDFDLQVISTLIIATPAAALLKFLHRVIIIGLQWASALLGSASLLSRPLENLLSGRRSFLIVFFFAVLGLL